MDSVKNSYHQKLLELLDQPGFPEDAFYIQKALAGRDIILYGAGECSHWFVEIVMKTYGYRPIAVLDRAYHQGMSYEGVPAFHPDEYTPSEREKKDAVVIISIGHQVHYPGIIRQLQQMGFQNILLLRDMYEIQNLFYNPPALRELGFQYYTQNKESILAALDLFEDDESRAVYTLSLETHLRRIPVPLPDRPRPEQYFPTDIKPHQGYDRFINCGAYDGDVIRLLYQTVGKVEEIVCFEPEPAIFGRLVDFLRTSRYQLAERITAIPNAVYSHETQMPFLSGTGLGSRISKNGDSWVQTVSLDSLFPVFNPTFICMDVEGVEPEVLKGAETLIQRCKPDLAICVYHSPDHLWEIPLYLNRLEPGYKLYLRNYTSFCVETVLYAFHDHLGSGHTFTQNPNPILGKTI